MIPMYSKAEGCVGYCLIKYNSNGDTEMTGFVAKEKDVLGTLKSVLDEMFPYAKIEESDWAVGYTVQMENSRWTNYTIYVTPKLGIYTLYEAIPDTWKGIDIEDEKLICEGDINKIIKKLTELEL